MTATHRHKLIALEDAADKLLSFFPDLRDTYNREVDSGQCESPGPYVVYEDMFYPHIETLLSARDANGLQRAFDFVEFLMTAADGRLHDLVRIAILTRLAVDPVRLAEARRYMGPATTAAVREVQNG